MHQYSLERVFEAEHRITVDTVFAETYDLALEVTDLTYLEVHLEAKERPSAIRLRESAYGDELVFMPCHFDVVAEG